MTLWWNRVRRVVVLVLLMFGTFPPPPVDRPDARLLAGIGCLLIAVGWLTWTFAPPTNPLVAPAIVLVAVAGTGVAVLSPNSASLAFPAIACLHAGRHLSRSATAALVVAISAGYVAGRILLGGGSGWLLVLGPTVFVVTALVGVVRAQNARLEADAQAARAESAALDERSRIAREIHDVLAHSLSALTVQLETADALLEGGRVEQARDSVRRAGQLAREGMTETRRAIGALRGEAVPLQALVESLAAGYRLDQSGSVAVRVTGEPGRVRPDSALALFRTAQEALTNVRKHAPGAQVTVDLCYYPESVSLVVVNGPAARDAPMAAAGGGYGLTGIRERAELAGGTFAAGRSGAGYRVAVTIPR